MSRDSGGRWEGGREGSEQRDMSELVSSVPMDSVCVVTELWLQHCRLF